MKKIRSVSAVSLGNTDKPQYLTWQMIEIIFSEIMILWTVAGTFFHIFYLNFSFCPFPVAATRAAIDRTLVVFASHAETLALFTSRMMLSSNRLWVGRRAISLSVWAMWIQLSWSAQYEDVCQFQLQHLQSCLRAAWLFMSFLKLWGKRCLVARGQGSRMLTSVIHVKSE